MSYNPNLSLGLPPDLAPDLPWYRKTLRWGQTNMTELDPIRYDVDWWRDYWQRTRVQGVIINAGGIVAYYPSRYPLHYRARHLEKRDLFGELSRVAHEDGLVVLARMDSNRAGAEFFREHSNWFAHDRDGKVYQVGDHYMACINSPYYSRFLPDLLREIVVNYQPQGFTDNSWSGLDRGRICYCSYCERKFFDDCGYDLPTVVDWDDPIYRAWIRWNYACRLAIWDLNNGVTQAVGGPDCLWLGMNSGNIYQQSMHFRDTKAIAERSELLMLDYQARGSETTFYHNGDAGKRWHSLLGWDKLIPESMAQYQSRTPTFRLASKPGPENQLWMVEGFAGGLQPWWHFISAYHEDRRQYRMPVSLLRWHEGNEQYLIDRRPIASVGVLWSQENIDFYGRDNANERVMMPYNGMIRALIRSRIPYLPLHIDHVARDGDQFKTLILPNLAAVSDAQVQSLRHFVAGGGNLVVTGESTLYTAEGDRRPDFALGDLLGVEAIGDVEGSMSAGAATWENYEQHSYLRLTPEQRATIDGPHIDDEPPPVGERHQVLRGFGETDILPFGGRLEVVAAARDVEVPLTWIPPFPIYPPEFAWMRESTTDYPALALRQGNLRQGRRGGRVAYFAADIDRCYARYPLPDHGDLLANVVRWANGEELPLYVEGPGLIDAHLYHQPGRLILHLVNLTATSQMPMEAYIPVGPLQVTVKLPADVSGEKAQLLVNGFDIPVAIENGWLQCEAPTVRDHEVIVIT